MRSHARSLENLPRPRGLAGWCICLWVCSAVASGRGHLGYMIPFEHMSVPVRALKLGIHCVFQVSMGVSRAGLSWGQQGERGGRQGVEGWSLDSFIPHRDRRVFGDLAVPFLKGRVQGTASLTTD